MDTLGSRRAAFCGGGVRSTIRIDGEDVHVASLADSYTGVTVELTEDITLTKGITFNQSRISSNEFKMTTSKKLTIDQSDIDTNIASPAPMVITLTGASNDLSILRSTIYGHLVIDTGEKEYKNDNSEMLDNILLYALTFFVPDSRGIRITGSGGVATFSACSIYHPAPDPTIEYIETSETADFIRSGTTQNPGNAVCFFTGDLPDTGPCEDPFEFTGYNDLVFGTMCEYLENRYPHVPPATTDDPATKVNAPSSSSSSLSGGQIAGIVVGAVAGVAALAAAVYYVRSGRSILAHRAYLKVESGPGSGGV